MHICMDWKAIKFDWNRARAFLVTAEEGSLSAAARALGTTQPTLGRQVSALEAELGVALFERTGRGLELTSAGLDIVEHARAMGEAANRLSLAATGQSSSLTGVVCISATEAMAAFDLPVVIRRLRKLEPGIEVEIIASNSTSDLKRREADIAIRAFRPTQPDLIARKLRDEYARLYATPQYLEGLDNPSDANSLASAEFIGFDRSSRLIDGLAGMGLQLTLKNFLILTENHLVHWELVKQSAGIGIMPERIGDKESSVVRVLPDMQPFPIELWLVAHRELRTSRRIRRVFDVLFNELSD